VKITRQRKVSIAILAVAGAAFAVDRMFVGPPVLGPAPASAAGASVAAEPQATPTRPAALVKVVSVADRVEALRANATASLDAFAAPTDWLPPAPEEPDQKAAPAERSSLPALTGVFTRLRTGGPVAIINRKQVRAGQTVDGWQVEKILGGRSGEQPGVVLVKGDRREVLTIESALTNPPAAGAHEPLTVKSAQAPDGPGRH